MKPRTNEWETYCDECYYHMWRVRRKNERGFNDGFHVQNGDGARQLVELLNKQDDALTAVTEQRDEALSDLEFRRDLYALQTKQLDDVREQRDRLLEEREQWRLSSVCRELVEQRDEARKLAEKYRYLSCDSQEEADAEVLPWENNQPTEP